MYQVCLSKTKLYAVFMVVILAETCAGSKHLFSDERASFEPFKQNLENNVRIRSSASELPKRLLKQTFILRQSLFYYIYTYILCKKTEDFIFYFDHEIRAI